MITINKRSVVISWIMSYVVIVLLSLVSNVVIYSNAISSIKDNAVDLNNEILANEKQNADELIDEVQMIAQLSLYNEQILDAAKYAAPLSNIERHDLMSLNASLTKGQDVSENIRNVYVYFMRSDYVVSSISTAESHLFYLSMYGGSEGMTEQQWYEMIIAKHNGTFLYKSGKLFYVKSITEIGQENPVATIVIELEPTAFSARHRGGRFVVLDKDDLVLGTDLSDEDKAVLSGLNFEKPGDVVTTELGGEKYMVLRERSNSNRWTYLYLIDYGEFMQRVYSIRWVFVVSILVSLLLGGFVFTRTVMHNQKPIRNIIDLINKNMGLSKKRGYNNELEFIELAIMNAIEENNASIKQRDITEKVVRESMLAKFLKDDGRMGIFNMEYLRSANIRFRYTDFVVVAISIEKIEDAFFDHKGTARENTELSVVVIKNILDEMLGEKYDVQDCEIDGMIIKILNADYIPDVKDVQQILEKASDIIMGNFNIEFVASISMVAKTGENLPICYSQAIEAMNYKYIVSKNIIAYRDVDFDCSSTYAFSMEVEEQLINCLRSGEFEKGKMILDDIFENSINNSETPIVLLRCIMYDVVGTIVKLLNEMPKEQSNEMIAKIKILDSLSRTTNVNLLKTEVVGLIREFCEKRTVTSDNKVDHVLDNVKDYINENYFDSSLSVQMLADKYDINSSYLSTLFKKNNGYGLLEYITKVRIEKAKSILKTEDKTIEEVSEMTGYSNSRTFSRVFVKYVGITPGKYKKS